MEIVLVKAGNMPEDDALILSKALRNELTINGWLRPKITFLKDHSVHKAVSILSTELGADLDVSDYRWGWVSDYNDEFALTDSTRAIECLMESMKSFSRNIVVISNNKSCVHFVQKLSSLLYKDANLQEGIRTMIMDACKNEKALIITPGNNDSLDVIEASKDSYVPEKKYNVVQRQNDSMIDHENFHC